MKLSLLVTVASLASAVVGQNFCGVGAPSNDPDCTFDESCIPEAVDPVSFGQVLQWAPKPVNEDFQNGELFVSLGAAVTNNGRITTLKIDNAGTSCELYSASEPIFESSILSTEGICTDTMSGFLKPFGSHQGCFDFNALTIPNHIELRTTLVGETTDTGSFTRTTIEEFSILITLPTQLQTTTDSLTLYNLPPNFNVVLTGSSFSYDQNSLDVTFSWSFPSPFALVEANFGGQTDLDPQSEITFTLPGCNFASADLTLNYACDEELAGAEGCPNVDIHTEVVTVTMDTNFCEAEVSVVSDVTADLILCETTDCASGSKTAYFEDDQAWLSLAINSDAPIQTVTVDSISIAQTPESPSSSSLAINSLGGSGANLNWQTLNGYSGTASGSFFVLSVGESEDLGKVLYNVPGNNGMITFIVSVELVLEYGTEGGGLGKRSVETSVAFAKASGMLAPASVPAKAQTNFVGTYGNAVLGLFLVVNVMTVSFFLWKKQ